MDIAALKKDPRLQDESLVWNLHGLVYEQQKIELIPAAKYVEKNRQRLSRTMNGEYLQALQRIEQEHSVTLDVLVHFIWHKVLQVYSFTSETRVLMAAQGHRTELNDYVYSLASHDSTEEKLHSCLEAAASVAFQSLAPLTDIGESITFNSALLISGDSVEAQYGQFPLIIQVDDNAGDEWGWRAHYDEALIDPNRIKAMLELAEVILSHVVENPQKKVSELEFLSAEQKQQFIAWNDTSGDYPNHKRLNEFFEDAGARTPDKVALVFEDKSLTYQALNESANQLAHVLLENAESQTPGGLIPLFLDTNELIILTVIAIWKSGAAFVPIDTRFPQQRIKFIIEDTSARRIITNRHHIEALTQYSVMENQLEIIAIEDLLQEINNRSDIPRTNINRGFRSDQPAYMTYTSGTTGVPKGVLKEHRRAANSITELTVQYDIGQVDESVVLFSPYVFEPFVRQLLIALINNQRLVMITDNDKLDPDKFQQFINRHEITYLHGTGSVLLQYDLSQCPSLKRLVLVGEELTKNRYQQLRKMFKGRIIGEYSFTESAFVTAITRFDENDKRDNKSIGSPLRNVTCYVLNEHLKELPVGTIGQLYVGGVGVGKGYWNRPELTKERYIVNPLQRTEDKRKGFNDKIYGTGDLVRRLPNGQLEYLGRNDFQLKINGIRIEPGEIEAVTLKYPGMKQCVVDTRELKNTNEDSSSRHLVGYYRCSPPGILESEVITYLQEHLPRYMVPVRMIYVERFPLTVNGKVDLKALSNIEINSEEKQKTASRNSLDSELAEIWSNVLGLGVEHIGIDNHFFRLGADSIKCIRFIALLRRKLHLTLNIEQIFRLQTIRKLSDYLAKQAEQSFEPEVLTNDVIIRNSEAGNENGSILLANGLQQGFMYQYLKQNSPGNEATYVMQSIFHYRKVLCPEKFRRAWEIIQEKYAALRLRFRWEDEPIQIIQAEQSLNWEWIDLTTINDSDTQVIEKLKAHDKRTPYQLESDNLFRIYLLKHAEKKFTFLFSCHHIILDGWSMPVLFDDFHAVYQQLVAGHSLQNLLSVSRTYEQTQAYLHSHRQDHIDYWTQQIDSIDSRGDYNGLINERSRYKVVVTNYSQIQDQRSRTITFDHAVSDRLKASCTQEGITLHSVLQFVWHSVLHRIGKGAQTVVGTVISGRNLPIDGIEKSVGLHINTLPLIVDHTQLAGLSVLGAIKQIQSKVFAMNSRSNVELGQLQKGKMKHQLFDSLFVLENHPEMGEYSGERFWHSASYELEKLDYPLAAIASDNVSQGIGFTLCYASELFEDSTIGMLLDMVELLYRQVAIHIDQPMSKVAFLSADQHQQQVSWNATDKDFPESATLHACFEEVVQCYGEKTALVYEDTQISYQQMNRQANRLAHYLRSLTEIKPDRLIALMLDKNERMMISIVGVWKSGAAYVPIDPSFPVDRIGYILKDTAAQVIITNKCHLDKLQDYKKAGIQVIAVEDAPLEQFPDENPTPLSCSTDLAYVIYTSGTTGNPKGVMVEHQGVVNLQKSLASLFTLRDGPEESFLSFSNYVFDHFVEQMTDALLNGQKLVILNDDMRSDKPRFYQYMIDSQVTYLSGTPSVLSIYEYDTIESLTRIDAVGEDFTETLFNKIRRTFKGQIINGYGPTEVSITTHKRPYDMGEARANKSIGHLVDNITCYVLDAEMRQLPAGAIGELYLGGIGVARGYLNREQLSAERFISNPHQTDEEKKVGRNARIYKTGDVARWLENGEIEYLGREDSQVKIRGLRIELAEIQAVIAAYPGVSQAVVIARDKTQSESESGGHKYLVGFYVTDSNISPEIINAYLYTKLPEYMVPNQLLPIDRVPVTVSGKLDTKALPVTEFTSNSLAYVAPQSAVEITLCAIWSELLGLDPEKIGINDSFFYLGGDSILATRLAYMITDTFGRNIGVAGTFSANTIALQSQWVSSSVEVQLNVSAKNSSSASASRLSLSQERLLFITEFENGTHAYNIVIHQKMPAATNTGCLEKALQAVVSRHSALRTLYTRQSDGTALQQVVPDTEFPALLHIEQLELTDKAELDQWMIQESEYVFDLASTLPLRAAIIHCEGACYLNLVIHHICFDGWSWHIFKRDFDAFYHHYLDDSYPLTLPTLQTSYVDFARWQRAYLSGDKLNRLSAYWLDKLQGFEPLNLMVDYPRPAQFDYSGQECLFDVDKVTTDKLRSLAKRAKVSFYSLLMSVYCLMLSRYSGQRDIVIGFPVANRPSAELENMVGFFTNMLALRVDVSLQAEIITYIQSVSREIINAQIHQDMPFEKLVKCLGIDNDPSRHPVFQVIFTFDLLESGDRSVSSVPEFSMQRYLPENGGRTTAKYDLSGWISETDNGLHGNFTYAARLFRSDTIAGLASTFQRLLVQIATLSESDHSTLAQLQVIDDKTVQQLLSSKPAINTKANVANSGKALHQVFEQAVVEHPDRTALIYNDVSLCYQTLNHRANQLAHMLLARVEVQPDDLIALLLDKSDDMLVSILAVWKAGAGYVPIDPNAPSERVRFILEDTGAKLLITHRQSVELSSDIEQIQLGTTAVSEILEKQTIENPIVQANSDSLAYVIYTSGTTGQPKGVMVEHGSVVNLRDDLQQRYFGSDIGRAHPQVALLLANYVFDFSVEQIIVSLLSGNTLLVYCEEHDPETFYSYANTHSLTFMSGTPTHIQQFDLSCIPSLETLVVAGEAFTQAHYNKVRRGFNGRLVNAYGVTEATVYNTVKIFSDQEGYESTLGEPLSNMQLLVMDEQQQLLPPGAVGELCLTGDCLSRGYLNRAKLTAEKFVSNPYQSESQKREGRCATLYRTGDLVRYLPNGELTYLGRNDSQIKIRGLRVEPDEIQNLLAAFPGVEQCAILARSIDGATEGMQLVGYFVSKDPVINEYLLLEYLGKKLPAYMVPVRLVRVEDQIPMTINGKVEVAALPIVTLTAQKAAYVAPRNHTEAALCHLWAALLGNDQIGIDDDFFKCGGDSILAMTLVSNIQREIQQLVRVKDIFECSTIRSLCDNVLQVNNTTVSFDSEQDLLSGSVPLLPIQEWFFAKPLQNTDYWNQSFTLKTPSLEIPRLEAALVTLVNFHDAFRLRFVRNKDEVEQHYLDRNIEVELQALDVSHMTLDQINDQLMCWQSAFDLQKGEVFTVCYLHGFDDGSACIWFAMHHLIVDSISWRIIARDLRKAYSGGELGAKGSSYRQWSQAIRNYRAAPGEQIYWQNMAAEVRDNPASLSRSGEHVHQSNFSLEDSCTEVLLASGHYVYDTRINDLMLTALGMALHELTGERRHYVTLEGHGREDISATLNVNNTVGWFTTLYPVAIDIAENIAKSIGHVRAFRQALPRQGIGYGALMGYVDNPMPSISFNYLGQFDINSGRDDDWCFLNQFNDNNRSQQDIQSSDSVIDVTAAVRNGQLHFDIQTSLGDTSTRQFSHALNQSLTQLVSHLREMMDKDGLAYPHATSAVDVRQFDPYVEFNADRTDRPILFLLPPGEGGAESYFNNLVKHLGEFRLVVFNNYYLHHNSPDMSFEQLAQYYLTFIREKQPSGPYHFVGWSFGGVLSLEIARQLVEAGERVSYLNCIDSYFNVREASEAIGLHDERNIIDKINYGYAPDPDSMARLVAATDNIVLFKAEKMNDTYTTENQQKLYSYYMGTTHNNLDTLIDPAKLSLIKMSDDNHVSWVNNERLLISMSFLLATRLLPQSELGKAAEASGGLTLLQDLGVETSLSEVDYVG